MIKLNEAYFSLVLNKQPNLEEQVRYLDFFEKVYISACALASITEEQKWSINKMIQQKKITLPRNFTKKKTLFIDLDSTLIISSTIKNSLFHQSFHFKDVDLYFSLRPHALQFLQKVSAFYQIILYSSNIPNYVIEFFNYFNSKTNNSIKKCLTRQHCLQIRPNLFTQSLKLIKNRQPQKVIFLSHDIFSFHQNFQNGIPIPPFNGSSHDRDLLFILQYLIHNSNTNDIRLINQETFAIRKICFPKSETVEEDSHDQIKSSDETKY